jgi:sulfoacetaldehyde acetyltransferase
MARLGPGADEHAARLWTQVIDIELPQMVRFERPRRRRGRPSQQAAELLSNARSRSSCPGPAWSSGAIPDLVASWPSGSIGPVCSNYQHNDSFPGSHPLALARWATTAPRPRWN